MRLVAVDTIRTELQPNVCLLRLRTDEGLEAYGESFWGAPAVEAYLHDTVALQLAALPSLAPVDVAARLRPYVGFSGSGAEIRGNGAIDIALWDLLGKRAELPVAQLLGGPLKDRFPVYNTCAGYSYIKDEGRQSSTNWGLPAGSPVGPYEDLATFLRDPGELALSLAKEGYTAMKVWPFDSAAEASRGHDISLTELRRGITSLEAIREAVPDMDIMIEMHSNWSLKGATKILRALQDIHPYWVEDPMRNDSVDAYRRLRDRVDVPIAAGEALTGTRAFKPLLDSGAIDVAIVDAGWTGGITEAVRIAALADTYGAGFAPHDCTGPLSFAVCSHVVMSQPNGLFAETVRAFHDSWYPQVFDSLPTVKDGLVEINSRPGLGVQMRDDFVTRSDTTVRTTVLSTT